MAQATDEQRAKIPLLLNPFSRRAPSFQTQRSLISTTLTSCRTSYAKRIRTSTKPSTGSTAPLPSPVTATASNTSSASTSALSRRSPRQSHARARAAKRTRREKLFSNSSNESKRPEGSHKEANGLSKEYRCSLSAIASGLKSWLSVRGRGRRTSISSIMRAGRALMTAKRSAKRIASSIS
jgi:hypothetical protein